MPAEHGGVSCLKPKPHALVKRERQATIKAKSRAEDRKVRLRSRGRCEVAWIDDDWFLFGKPIEQECHRNAVGEPHHLISGSGRRKVGPSILAEWKLATCHECHRLITEHILVPVNPRADASHVMYRRVQ